MLQLFAGQTRLHGRGGRHGRYGQRGGGAAPAGRCATTAGSRRGPGPASHVRAGFNYRLTEMQSIIGINELERLDTWNLARRRGFAKIYDHAFSQLSGVHCVPLSTPERQNAYWKYPLQLDREKLAGDPREIREAHNGRGNPRRGELLARIVRRTPVFGPVRRSAARMPMRCAGGHSSWRSRRPGRRATWKRAPRR